LPLIPAGFRSGPAHPRGLAAGIAVACSLHGACRPHRAG